MTKGANRTHPETKCGEILLLNAYPGFVDGLAFETKRMGVAAYDINGNIIPDMRPIFVQRGEFIEKGGDPDKPWFENLPELLNS
jgi:hypothetical protein